MTNFFEQKLHFITLHLTVLHHASIFVDNIQYPLYYRTNVIHNHTYAYVSEDEDEEEMDDEEEDKFYSADEGYDASHPEDGEGGDGTGSDSDQSPQLNKSRPKVNHILSSFLPFFHIFSSYYATV